MNRKLSSRGSYTTTLVTILVLALFLIITIGITFFQAKETTGEIISQDLNHLAHIFARIDEQCEIRGFDAQKNPINFLTIKKDGFVGSEVGPMNLAYPEHWQGPYVDHTPEVQGKLYEVVRIRGSYYVAPGTGVKLPNGKVIGTDIVLDEDADIYALMDEQNLMFEGKPLVVPLTTAGTPAEDETMAEEMV